MKGIQPVVVILLSSIIVIGLIFGSIGSITSASFSDSEQSANNTFTFGIQQLLLEWNTFLGAGGGGGDDCRAIAVDNSGNVYIVGSSFATWGSPVRSHGAGYDAFVAKLNSSGVLQWNTFLGGGGTDYGCTIAVDSSGNVYVGGHSGATWGSPMRSWTGGYDAWAAKLDSSGALQWNTFLGGSGTDDGYGIAVDSSGNVYISGRTSATWGGSPVRGYTAGYDVFVAKLNTIGVLQWNTFLGGNGNDNGYATMAVDSSGNVYIGGYSTVTWGSPVRAWTGGWDAWAANLNTSGALQWHSFLGGSGYELCYGVAVDGSGNVYVTGISSSSTWGTSPVQSKGVGYDAFATKLNSSGALQWYTFLGGDDPNDYGYAVVVEGSGNIYVSGYSTVSWGSPVRPFTAVTDAFAAKLNTSGNLLWNTFLGGDGTDQGYGIGVDSSGNVYVGGRSDATWGSPIRAYTAGNDAFAAKLAQ